jgi:ferredoxin, 2Fe-2S
MVREMETRERSGVCEVDKELKEGETPQTHKVTFLPMNVTVEAKRGQNILEIALANHIPLDHNCGGNCACSTCHVIVREGFEKLPPMSEEESDQLDEAEGLTLTSRLGCQVKVFQDIVVEIPQGSSQAWRKAEQH